MSEEIKTNKKIEIHFVVELTNNSINRSCNGELKKTVDAFGNTYQYISRQCVNRNVREKKMKDDDNRQGIKITRKEFVEMVDAELVKAGLTEEKEIEEIREAILDAYNCGNKKKDNNGDNKKKKKDDNDDNDDADKKDETKVDNLIVFLSNKEIAVIVEALKESNWDKTKIGKTIENCKNELQMSRDVALFGRMIANNRLLNVRGALNGSDLIGITRCKPVNDFYSSSSDYGYTSLGNIEVASTIFYGCTVIDVGTLIENLNSGKFGKSELETILSWKYLKDFVENFGKGREHGKFNRTYPFYIAVGVTEGNACAIGHHVITDKKNVKEIADAMHDNLANHPCRIEDGFKFVEMNEITGEYGDFKKFIKENILDMLDA